MAILFLALSFCYIYRDQQLPAPYTLKIDVSFIKSPLIPYQTDWLDRISIKSLKSGLKPSPNCTCNFSPQRTNDTDSTPSDLIIGGVFGVGTGLAPFIKSWSSINSKATLVLLVDDKVQNYIKQLNLDSCPLNIISIGDFPNMTRHVSLFRFPVFDFLIKFGANFDRIILTDVGDCIFQNDPFRVTTDWPYINFAEQLPKLLYSSQDYLWLNRIEMWRVYTGLDTELINAGLYASTSRVLIDTIRLICHVYDLPRSNRVLVDQGVVNYLINSDYLADAGIEYKTKTRNSIMTFYLYWNNYTGKFPILHNRHEDVVAGIFHNYDKHRDSVESALEKCMLGEYGNEPFEVIRGLKKNVNYTRDGTLPYALM